MVSSSSSSCLLVQLIIEGMVQVSRRRAQFGANQLDEQERIYIYIYIYLLKCYKNIFWLQVLKKQMLFTALEAVVELVPLMMCASDVPPDECYTTYSF